MDFCDQSVIDWDAVAAVGTWAVGIGAGLLAWKASALAHQLHREASAREERGARVIIAGVRHEMRDYAARFTTTSETLTGHLAAPPTATRLEVQQALEDIEKHPLREIGDRASALGALPQSAVDTIADLYAQEVRLREILALALRFYRTPHVGAVGGALDHAFNNSIRLAAGALSSEANKATQVASEIATYLGIPPADATTPTTA